MWPSDRAGFATLMTRRRSREHSVLRQAMAAADILHRSNACSLKIKCVAAVNDRFGAPLLPSC
jgi:hypothetical protein